MAQDADGREVKDGDAADVVAGTHKGRSGTVEASNVSKTGAATLTIRMADGDRLKTLAKNVRKK